MPIEVRQVKYLNNIVEQDHRAIKRITRPMLNFKSFRSAGCVLAVIELMHMIRKASSPSMLPMSCRLPISFMRWHDKSVQCRPEHAHQGKSRPTLNNATEPASACLLEFVSPSLMRAAPVPKKK
jgi:hypothetical protein